MVWKWCPEILFLHLNLTVLLRPPIRPIRPIRPPIRPIRPLIRPIRPPIRPLISRIRPIRPQIRLTRPPILHPIRPTRLPIRTISPPIWPIRPPIIPIRPIRQPNRPIRPPIRPIRPPIYPIRPVIRLPIWPIRQKDKRTKDKKSKKYFWSVVLHLRDVYVLVFMCLVRNLPKKWKKFPKSIKLWLCIRYCTGRLTLWNVRLYDRFLEVKLKHLEAILLKSEFTTYSYF